MIKNIKQHLTKMKYWLYQVSEHNDKTIKITASLRMALFNLKIQQAHLGDNAKAIAPIAVLLEKTIKELHDNTENLVSSGRKELRESYDGIEKYIENNN